MDREREVSRIKEESKELELNQIKDELLKHQMEVNSINLEASKVLKPPISDAGEAQGDYVMSGSW